MKDSITQRKDSSHPSHNSLPLVANPSHNSLPSPEILSIS